MAVLQEFKCPCCDGGIEFDSKAQKMKCPYCDSTFDIETLTSYQAALEKQGEDAMEWDVSAGQAWTEDETSGMRSYVCQSCGGEVTGDASMGATDCPFCGNPVIVKDQFDGALKPDLVIPFKLSKEDAKAALKKHYSGKRLLPKVFQDENRIEEVKGIYVPFWLFEADADAYIRYKATRVRRWSSGDYYYKETKHYSVIRSGDLGFDWVPVDGSSKIANDLMESIEPFNLADAVDFQTAYLSGYLADKYDVTAAECVERVNARVRNSTEMAFAATVLGYDTVIPTSSSIQLQNGKAKYALYPVWLLNTDWNGQKYTFAMNGQTGKLVGDLPLDKVAYRKWLFGLTVAFAAGVYALSYLWWLL